MCHADAAGDIGAEEIAVIDAQDGEEHCVLRELPCVADEEVLFVDRAASCGNALVTVPVLLKKMLPVECYGVGIAPFPPAVVFIDDVGTVKGGVLRLQLCLEVVVIVPEGCRSVNVAARNLQLPHPVFRELSFVQTVLFVLLIGDFGGEVGCAVRLCGEDVTVGVRMGFVVIVVLIIGIPLRHTVPFARKFIVMDMRPYIFRFIAIARQPVLFVHAQALIVIPRVDAACRGVR